MKEAQRIAQLMLRGAGTSDWEQREIGESAIHVRRRLNTQEVVMLHKVNARCPVFTHGDATRILLSAS